MNYRQIHHRPDKFDEVVPQLQLLSIRCLTFFACIVSKIPQNVARSVAPKWE
jgi:hypothetical protein